ncbi:MAG: hypothetical protein WAN86_06595 [Hyphomicrobiaceae bacterium]
MRSSATSCLAVAFALAAGAAGLLVGPGSPSAWACGRGHGCGGYGYRPAPAYYAPPVYSLTYAPYGAHAGVYQVTFYTTRVNIFRGPRWGYAAAYYNPRRQGSCGRRARACTHRAYMSGPFVRGWRRW